jgi:hypothetical protein
MLTTPRQEAHTLHTQQLQAACRCCVKAVAPLGVVAQSCCTAQQLSMHIAERQQRTDSLPAANISTACAHPSSWQACCASSGCLLLPWLPLPPHAPWPWQPAGQQQKRQGPAAEHRRQQRCNTVCELCANCVREWLQVKARQRMHMVECQSMFNKYVVQQPTGSSRSLALAASWQQQEKTWSATAEHALKHGVCTETGLRHVIKPASAPLD